MLYWYPKIKDIEIPQPRTEIVKLSGDHFELIEVIDGKFDVLKKEWHDIIKAGRKIGYPLFMRTDHFSGKHNWKRTCYVEKEEDLKQHISALFDDNYMCDLAGLPINALVFRKYIQMNNLFKAFRGEMPVNPEFRIMIRDGKFERMFWYWVEDAIEGSHLKSMPNNWKSILKQAKKDIAPDDLCKLQDMAVEVAQLVHGYWSIDFCQAKDGTWYLIDMAEGERSWIPETLSEKVKNGGGARKFLDALGE